MSAGSERYTPGELLAYLRFWCAYGRSAASAGSGVTFTGGQKGVQLEAQRMLESETRRRG